MVSVSGKILFVSLIDALEAESIGFISKRWSKEVLSTSSAQKINGPLWIANALMLCETNGLVHMERVGCSKETSKSACPDTLTTAKPYSLTTDSAPLIVKLSVQSCTRIYINRLCPSSWKV